MSVEALWILKFDTISDYGGGVVVLETERVFGGDTSFYWTGNYTVSREDFRAKIDVKRHSPILPSIIGPDSYTITLEGKVGEDEMVLKGTVEGQTAPILQARLTRTAELP